MSSVPHRERDDICMYVSFIVACRLVRSAPQVPRNEREKAYASAGYVVAITAKFDHVLMLVQNLPCKVMCKFSNLKPAGRLHNHMGRAESNAAVLQGTQA